VLKITFYGGVDEIGGNKILLEDGDSRIFLDFGMNFSRHAMFFTEFMPVRKCTCVRDMIELGLLPKMDGIYRRDYCKHMGLDCKKETSVDGVLISHAHIDHLGYTHFLRKDISIHCSKESRAIMELFDQTGAGAYNDFTTFNPSFQLVAKKDGNPRRRTARDGKEERKVTAFEYGREFKIGNFAITPYRVDHSLPGATAFVIETSEGSLVYTGDLRFHGRHADFTNKFAESAKKAEPEIMLSEGTRMNSTEIHTEEYVEKESTKLIKDKKGVVIANFPLRDTDRLLTFYNTAVKNNRKLVLECRQALLLDLLRKEGVTELPASDDENIRVYFPKKGWGLIGRNDFPEEEVERDYYPWEKLFLNNKNVIDSNELRNSQEKYILFMNYFQLNNLVDIKPIKGSTHIRSICEPFSDEMELDEKRVRNWLEKFNLSPAHQIHASGHAPRQHIRGMIEKIAPKVLTPIHTEHPELFKKFHKNIKFAKTDSSLNFK